MANTYFAKNEKFNTKNIQDLNKKINFRVFNNGKIFVDNLTSESIEIKKLTLLEKKNVLNVKKKRLPSITLCFQVLLKT